MTPALCSLFSAPETYNTMGLLKLKSVIFAYYKASVNDEHLVKYLLACSPSLKVMVIRPQYRFLVSGKKFMTAKKLKLHRASPVVHMSVY